MSPKLYLYIFISFMNNDSSDHKIKEYSNNEITVVWNPKLCDHSAICISELPKVFDNLKRPWIKMENAPTSDIIKIVDMCPTKALIWRKNDGSKSEKNDVLIKSTSVRLIKNGSVFISGAFQLIDENGNNINCTDRIALCRCNKSKKMPFCDGSHREENNI
jgi:uncharacterized Fe-S cluster protein YjdI